jgi:hypothetical protein
MIVLITPRYETFSTSAWIHRRPNGYARRMATRTRSAAALLAVALSILSACSDSSYDDDDQPSNSPYQSLENPSPFAA